MPLSATREGRPIERFRETYHFRPRALASHSLSRLRGRVGWGCLSIHTTRVCPHPNPPPRRAGEGAQYRKLRYDQNFGNAGLELPALGAPLCIVAGPERGIAQRKVAGGLQ
jgi:hypothetical protein